MSLASPLAEPEFAPSIPQRVYPTGMLVALGGILMFFTALFSAWIVRKGLSASQLDVPIALPTALLGLNTAVLLASSATLEIARRKMRAGSIAKFRQWWCVTTALGISFLAGQLAAWRALAVQGLYLASNPDASFFYLFTGAHALHLLGGVVGLLLVAFKPLKQLTLRSATRVSAMYWHFLTIVWIAIFAFLLSAK
ncbi:MAG TPA: cytochrome c oxidase subunit 3 [Candidatus Aquilonibacter sp.]|nr:cytochrome c oxidase subunit 3 [Candidatus Aquilonibacter sp.]